MKAIGYTYPKTRFVDETSSEDNVIKLFSEVGELATAYEKWRACEYGSFEELYFYDLMMEAEDVKHTVESFQRSLGVEEHTLKLYQQKTFDKNNERGYYG